MLAPPDDEPAEVGLALRPVPPDVRDLPLAPEGTRDERDHGHVIHGKVAVEVRAVLADGEHRAGRCGTQVLGLAPGDSILASYILAEVDENDLPKSRLRTGDRRVLVADLPDVPVAVSVGPSGSDGVLPSVGFVDRHRDDVDFATLGGSDPVRGHDRDPAAVREKAGELPP